MTCVTKAMKGGWKLEFKALLVSTDNNPLE
jgi:hypothetical protein